MERNGHLLRILPGISKAMVHVRRQVVAAGRRRGPVILMGEPGTGKDFAARAIHALRGPPAGVFAVADAVTSGNNGLDGLIPPGGTLYLDHCEASLEHHPAHWRRLVEAAFHSGGGVVLSVATSPRQEGHHLPLATPADPRLFAIHLPPLRRRREDIPLVLSCICRHEGCEKSLRLAPQDVEYLYDHSWPGNLNEMKAWVRDRLANAADILPDRQDLPLRRLLDREIASWVKTICGSPGRTRGILKNLSALVEKNVIAAVLAQTGGNQVEAAAILGINRNTLASKLRRYELSRSRREKTAAKATV